MRVVLSHEEENKVAAISQPEDKTCSEVVGVAD